MYLPTWVAATLALLNGVTEDEQALSKATRYIIAKHHDGQEYYLSVDHVYKGAVPKLVKMDGDKPPGDQGVWLFKFTTLKMPAQKIFVPDTHFCLRAKYEHGKPSEVVLDECRDETPEKGDSWINGLDAKAPAFRLHGDEKYALSFKGEDVSVVKHKKKSWSDTWHSRPAHWEMSNLD